MEGLRIKDFLAREGDRLGIKRQEDLARNLGVSEQTISNWVKAKTFPTHQMSKQLLDMGMTVEELFGYPYPSSADILKQKGALWEVLEDSLKEIRNHMKNNSNA